MDSIIYLYASNALFNIVFLDFIFVGELQLVISGHLLEAAERCEPLIWPFWKRPRVVGHSFGKLEAAIF